LGSDNISILLILAKQTFSFS